MKHVNLGQVGAVRVYLVGYLTWSDLVSVMRQDQNTLIRRGSRALPLCSLPGTWPDLIWCSLIAAGHFHIMLCGSKPGCAWTAQDLTAGGWAV